MMSNAAKNFDILAISSSILYNYFMEAIARYLWPPSRWALQYEGCSFGWARAAQVDDWADRWVDRLAWPSSAFAAAPPDSDPRDLHLQGYAAEPARLCLVFAESLPSANRLSSPFPTVSVARETPVASSTLRVQGKTFVSFISYFTRPSGRD